AEPAPKLIHPHPVIQRRKSLAAHLLPQNPTCRQCDAPLSIYRTACHRVSLTRQQRPNTSKQNTCSWTKWHISVDAPCSLSNIHISELFDQSVALLRAPLRFHRWRRLGGEDDAKLRGHARRWPCTRIGLDGSRPDDDCRRGHGSDHGGCHAGCHPALYA